MQKTLHKIGLGFKKMDFDRWDGWEIVLGLIPPFFSRHLVEQNVGNIICVCYFFNIVFVIFSILSQIQIAASLPKNQFREYHAWNRIEKIMPSYFTNFQKLLKLYENGQLVFKP